MSSETPPWFTAFIIELKKRISDEEFSNLKIRAEAFGFRRGEINKVESLTDLLQGMQKREKLGPNNLDTFKVMVSGCGPDMNHILKYIEQTEAKHSQPDLKLGQTGQRELRNQASAISDDQYIKEEKTKRHFTPSQVKATDVYGLDRDLIEENRKLKEEIANGKEREEFLEDQATQLRRYLEENRKLKGEIAKGKEREEKFLEDQATQLGRYLEENRKLKEEIENSKEREEFLEDQATQLVYKKRPKHYGF